MTKVSLMQIQEIIRAEHPHAREIHIDWVAGKPFYVDVKDIIKPAWFIDPEEGMEGLHEDGV